MRPRLIAAVIGVSALTLILIPSAHAQSGWSSWSCQWTVSNVPVPGGVLSGRGCAQWWTASGPPSWRIWGDTYAPYSAEIRTRIRGYDGCGYNEPTTFRMEGYAVFYNTTYGTSGNPVQGSAYNCTTGPHRYKVEGYHTITTPPPPSNAGSWGVVYW